MEQEWKNLGEQILDSVSGALKSGDFSRLNDLVSGTVDTVVKEAKKQADIEREKRARNAEMLESFFRNSAETSSKWEQQQQENNARQEQRREEWRRSREEHLKDLAEKARWARREWSNAMANSQNAEERQHKESGRLTENKLEKIRDHFFEPVGSVANILFTVFGSIGIGIGISLLFLYVITTLSPFGIIGSIFAIASMVMMITGSKQRGLLKRAKRYIQLCGNKMYSDLEDIAVNTGRTKRFIKKDLKKMLRKGMFPEGHLDKKETCFMLSDEVFHQYTETDKAYQMREEMEAQKNRALTHEEEEQAANAELNALVSEGMGYIQKLNDLNEAIPGEEVSVQLSQMENLLRQIFERVKEHPEQMHRMHKLMEYYLPTTVKLVEAYIQFEKVETPGQDIKGAKTEILKTLGIINEAFTELLNNLFQDEVFDATTDAQVLRTMLSREGLRREMSAEQLAVENEEEEDDDFTLTMEPELTPEPEVLKAPWES